MKLFQCDDVQYVCETCIIHKICCMINYVSVVSMDTILYTFCELTSIMYTICHWSSNVKSVILTCKTNRECRKHITSPLEYHVIKEAEKRILIFGRKQPCTDGPG